MGLFHPNSLIWGLLALVVTAFYFVRLARRRRRVSSMLLWERAFARRSPWQRWQRTVSLLVQLGLLILLVVTLAEPYWAGTWRSARQLVVIVDTSASMNATDVQPSRLARACRDALQLIDGLQHYERAAILTSGGVVRVQCGFTNDAETLAKAVAGIRPSDGDDQMHQAVELAVRMTSDLRNPKIFMLSDGCFPDAAELAGIENVVLMPTGEAAEGPVENIGITRLAARPALQNVNSIEVFVEATNFADQAIATRLTLDHGAENLVSEPLELAPNGIFSHVYSLEFTKGGLLTAKLHHDDHLLADNQASLVLPPVARVSIRVADGPQSADERDPARRLIRALQLLPWARVEQPGTVHAVDDRAIHVFVRGVPERLPEGPVLAIGPSGSCDLWNDSTTIYGDFVVPGSAAGGHASALLRDVELDKTIIEGLIRVDYEKEPDLVVRTEAGDAVLSAWDRPSGRVAFLQVPLGKTDLTMRSGFPVFVANAVRWLDDERSPEIPAYSTSDVAVRTSSASVSGSDVTTPEGLQHSLAEGQTRIGPLDEIGVWQVPSDEGGKGPLVLAANLVSAQESELRSPGDLPAAVADAPRGGGLLWPKFLLLAVVLLTAEWLVLGRHDLPRVTQTERSR